MRAENEAAVTWAKRCCGGGGKATSKSRGVDEDDGGVVSKGKVVFSGKARTGGRY